MIALQAHQYFECYTMKATGIVRRVDDLWRIVIPKEIRRTLKIREGDPSHTTLTPIDRFCWAIHSITERWKKLVDNCIFHDIILDKKQVLWYSINKNFSILYNQGVKNEIYRSFF